jgi:mRNA-degrading endonuclease toxin of MazEF toxin-antitoxin module
VVARGEVCWLELEQEGRRPVVVLTRDEALPRLHNVVVALVTRTIRGLDTRPGVEDSAMRALRTPVLQCWRTDQLEDFVKALTTPADRY